MGLFKAPEKRKFNYTPRFYDKTNDEIKKENIETEGRSEVNFSDRFHRKVNEKRNRQQVSMKRLLIMVALLILLIYIISVL